MKVTHIVASMMTVLAVLFILAPIYRKREIVKTQLERDYFSLLNEYKASNSEDKLNAMIEVGIKLFKTSDRDEVKSIIEEDLKKLGA